MEAWRTGLALLHAELEPSGRPFIELTVKTETDEFFFPFSIEAARKLRKSWNPFAARRRHKRTEGAR